MKVTIIGGGVAGCEAAYRLAEGGAKVELIEKENIIGGNLNNWYELFPDRKKATELTDILNQNLQHPNITLHLGTTAKDIKKDKEGKFNIQLNNKGIIESDFLLLATGFKLFNASRKEEYGYGIYENVITSVELENMFYNKKIQMQNGDEPKCIGFIHCVGSRDEKICNHHCSKVCCITAVKQAIEIRELCPDAEFFCFYMDMRMFGAGYEELYREAQEKYNIKFIRGRLSEASENIDKQVVIKAEDTLIGRPIRMSLDLMVLMVGMESSDETKQAATQLNLPLAANGFIKVNDPHYGNNLTSEEGVYIAGTCSAPMNITDVLHDARSAAAQILSKIATI
ncbi:MAG: FAD-dependent oxidoreductase [Odoribacter sp.]|nr:FAD-dependent oxidoreductase [Odoribacter sp.]